MQFENRVKKLLLKYPESKIDEQTNHNFWSGYRRIPKPLIFDSSDELSLKFVSYITILLCQCFSVDIKQLKNFDLIKNRVDELYKDKQKEYWNLGIIWQYDNKQLFQLLSKLE